MKIVGIAAEYDPFTNGHALHIARTRAAFDEPCAVVCVMSGSFTQRGEPACLGKFVRARAAASCGADLVLELPVDFALASAERFAFGAAALLDSLGMVDVMSFGSESGSVEELREAAALLASPELDELIRAELARGVSYAAARQKAAERLAGSPLELLKKPNNILGLEYIKALNTMKSTVRPFTVKRAGAHDGDHEEYPSASVLRTVLRSGGSVNGMAPERAVAMYASETAAGRAPVSVNALETAVLSRLRSMSLPELEALPDASDGLGTRVYKAARAARTLEELYALAKTKRYALSRIRRVAMCAYLGMTAADRAERPRYARVLAATETGRRLLRKNGCGLPVITKAAAAKRLPYEVLNEFLLETRATDLWSLGRPEPNVRLAGEDWLTSPSIV